MPDTPAALVTLAALHAGDPVRARSVIGRSVRDWQVGDQSDLADAIFVTHRHRLLLGWTYMQDGQLQAAGAAVPSAASSTLHRRDALWAAALQTAIARRSGDSGAMQKHWYTAMEVLAEYSADLFALLPLGELWVAAARMRQVEQLQHRLDEAFALLAGFGDPVLWSVPLHWAGVHAGILANAPDAVAPHGKALTTAAPHAFFAKALATAGRTWLRVLANHVDVEEVTRAARGLAQFGRHVGRDAVGRPGRPADHGSAGVAGDAAACTRPQTDRRDPRAAGAGPARRPVRGRGTASHAPTGPLPPNCPTVSWRSPNCCCTACTTATSARSCSSQPRPLNITSPGSAAGSGPNPGRRCCRCCARCSRPSERLSPYRSRGVRPAFVAPFRRGM